MFVGTVVQDGMFDLCSGCGLDVFCGLEDCRNSLKIWIILQMKKRNH